MVQLIQNSLDKQRLLHSITIDWNYRKTNGNIVSILNYINKNEIKIRDSYFNFIKSISQKKINGITLKDTYQYNSVYNLWQMSTVCEKSFYKSPQITNVIKFLAIELIIQERQPKEILLLNVPDIVDPIVREYCINSGLSYKKNNQIKSPKFKYFEGKNFIKGILLYSYKYLVNINIFNRPVNYFKGTESAFLVSYLTHFDKEKISRNYYGTGLWGDFPENLNNLELSTNWLHLPINLKNAKNLFKTLGLKRIEPNSAHNFLYSYLNFWSWLEILIDYIQVSLKSVKISSKEIFIYKNKTNLFPLFSKDFHSSTRGPVLLENLICIKSFEKIFSIIPTQKIGFYLQENQGWEFALNSAWRKYNHGKLISVQHSTVSFWDMRYYNSFKDYLYQPDAFVVNSLIAKKHFFSFNYNNNKVYVLEALRYQKLKKNKLLGDNNKVLILGDILKNATNEMLDSIYKAMPNCRDKSFYFKPHPAQPVEIHKNYNNIETIDKPLSRVLGEYNTVICPASSGAAVEAFYGNLNTIVFISHGELNTSPLKDFDGVEFFSYPEELERAIYKSNVINKNKEIFLIEEKIPKWNNFIKSILN